MNIVCTKDKKKVKKKTLALIQHNMNGEARALCRYLNNLINSSSEIVISLFLVEQIGPHISKSLNILSCMNSIFVRVALSFHFSIF